MGAKGPHRTAEGWDSSREAGTAPPRVPLKQSTPRRRQGFRQKVSPDPSRRPSPSPEARPTPKAQP